MRQNLVKLFGKMMGVNCYFPEDVSIADNSAKVIGYPGGSDSTSNITFVVRPAVGGMIVTSCARKTIQSNNSMTGGSTYQETNYVIRDRSDETGAELADIIQLELMKL